MDGIEKQMKSEAEMTFEKKQNKQKESLRSSDLRLHKTISYSVFK